LSEWLFIGGRSSEEVRNDVSVGHHLGALSNGVENIERSLQLLVNVKDGGNVSASVAVVRC